MLDRLLSAHPSRYLLLKLACLACILGGPLAVFGLLKTQLGSEGALALAFLPVVLLAVGIFALWEAQPTNWDRAMVWAGVVGATALAGMNLVGLDAVLNGRYGGNLVMLLGIVFGFLVAAAYVHASCRFFQSERDAAACPSPTAPSRLIDDPDPVVQGFCLLEEALGKIPENAARSALRRRLPDLGDAELRKAIRDARRLYDVYRRAHFYNEPSGEAAGRKALRYLREGAPGLSERAYALAASRIVRNWLY